jgi:hypothetical protein
MSQARDCRQMIEREKRVLEKIQRRMANLAEQAAAQAGKVQKMLADYAKIEAAQSAVGR